MSIDKKIASLLLVIIVLLSVLAVLGCTGQTNQATGGRPDLLAPYKNADGSLKEHITITDESINSTLLTGILDWAFFSASHPELEKYDYNNSTNPRIKMDFSMYQGNQYKAFVVNMTNLKEISTGNFYNYDVTVIVRETGDEPKAYIGYAALGGKDLLSTYPATGLFNVPTRLTIPDDRILDK